MDVVFDFLFLPDIPSLWMSHLYEVLPLGLVVCSVFMCFMPIGRLEIGYLQKLVRISRIINHRDDDKETSFI